MKLVIQRVKSAKVTVKDTGKVSGKINAGLFVLVGFKKGDTGKDAELLAVKLSRLRIMSDDQDKMNKSILDTGDSLLVVSQFTLYANTNDGNRPSFIEAEEPNKARELYEYFIEKLRELNIKVETGSFGDYMEIEASLDGPVTIML